MPSALTLSNIVPAGGAHERKEDGRRSNRGNSTAGTFVKLKGNTEIQSRHATDSWETAQRLDVETHLVEQCLAGEQSAWEELIQTYSRRVYAICYRFTNSDNESQDLTQEVFLRVFRTLGSFRAGEGCFTVWLTRLDPEPARRPLPEDQARPLDRRNRRQTVGIGGAHGPRFPDRRASGRSGSGRTAPVGAPEAVARTARSSHPP